MMLVKASFLYGLELCTSPINAWLPTLGPLLSKMSTLIKKRKLRQFAFGYLKQNTVDLLENMLTQLDGVCSDTDSARPEW